MDEEKLQSLTFHYIKSAAFRVIHVDGAMGGPTPNGKNIHISFWSERGALPHTTVHELTEEGRLGQEVSRSSREGVVRELEVDAIMTISTAKGVRDWLNRHIEAAERAMTGEAGE